MMVVGILIALLAGCGSPQRAGPILQVDPLAKEFPPGFRGDTRAEFVLANTGDQVLEIRDVRSSCGCAVPRMPNKHIAPKGFATMEVRVSQPPIGSRSATVTVVTNSPTTPTIQLKITSWARNNEPRIVQIIPPRVTFRADDDLADPQTVIVTTLEETGNLLLQSAHCDLPFVTVETANVEESQLFSSDFVQRKYRYFLRVRDSHPVGRFVGSLSIQRIGSDSKSSPNARQIPVEATFRPPVYADPDSLFGTLASRGELPTWEVSLRRKAGEAPCRIESIECDVGWLHVEMLDKSDHSPSDRKTLGRLNVTMVDRPAESSAHATIVAKTDYPQCPAIRIPVTFVQLDE